jgi:hypothetical protein
MAVVLVRRKLQDGTARQGPNHGPRAAFLGCDDSDFAKHVLTGVASYQVYVPYKLFRPVRKTGRFIAVMPWILHEHRQRGLAVVLHGHYHGRIIGPIIGRPDRVLVRSLQVFVGGLFPTLTIITWSRTVQ